MAVDIFSFLGIILVLMSVMGPFSIFRILIPYKGSNYAILPCHVLVEPYCHGAVEVNRLWPPLSRNHVAMEKGNVDAARSL